jgi:hypothetical protein
MRRRTPGKTSDETPEDFLRRRGATGATPSGPSFDGTSGWQFSPNEDENFETPKGHGSSQHSTSSNQSARSKSEQERKEKPEKASMKTPEQIHNQALRRSFETLQMLLRAEKRKLEQLLQRSEKIIEDTQNEIRRQNPISASTSKMIDAMISRMRKTLAELLEMMNRSLNDASAQPAHQGSEGTINLEDFIDRISTEVNHLESDQEGCVIELKSLLRKIGRHNIRVKTQNNEGSEDEDEEDVELKRRFERLRDLDEPSTKPSAPPPESGEEKPEEREDVRQNRERFEEEKKTWHLRQQMEEMQRQMVNIAGGVLDADRNAEKIRLPAVNIPRFSGDIAQWPTFWEAFYAVVGRRKDVPNFQKLLTLRKSLDGDAAQELEGYALDENTYMDQVERLKTRFGDRRLLVGSIIRKILFKPQCNRIEKAGPLIDFISAQLRILQILGLSLEDENMNIVLLSVIQSKCPTDITIKFEDQYRQREIECGKRPAKIEESSAPLTISVTAEDFLNFCSARIKALDSSRAIFADGKLPMEAAKAVPQKAAAQKLTPRKINANSGILSTIKLTKEQNRPVNIGSPSSTPPWKRSRSPQKGSTRTTQQPPAVRGQQDERRSRTTGDEPRDTPIGCLWCNEEHPSSGCQKHKSLDLKEKWARSRIRAKKGLWCHRCLSAQHTSWECNKGPCDVNGCAKPHHPHLHQ